MQERKREELVLYKSRRSLKQMQCSSEVYLQTVAKINESKTKFLNATFAIKKYLRQIATDISVIIHRTTKRHHICRFVALRIHLPRCLLPHCHKIWNLPLA